MIARLKGAPLAAFVFAATWLAYFGMLQFSVVRLRIKIVVTLTVAAVLLAWWLARRLHLALSPLVVAILLVGNAVVGLRTRFFSHVPVEWAWTGRGVLAAAAVAAAAALWFRRPRLALGTAFAAYAAATVIAIRTDPSPRIDVWITLQQAADAMSRGENFYAVTWVDSPGIQDAFTYLPWTAVLLAPGRWIAGDVRWMHLVWALVLTIGFWQLGTAARERRPAAATALDPRWVAAAAGSAILLVPGTLIQVDQAWTEPLLLTGLTWWAVLMTRGRAWWAIVPLALACASKQHLALVLPLLLAWRPFGPARAIATGALTGALIAPWFLTAPADFVRDTVILLMNFPPIRFANTWYLYLQHYHGITLPFWVTGLIVLGTLALAMLLIHRRQPPLGELLRWSALMLLVANLVNKQAFYNQYWLVGALVALSLIADQADHRAEDRLSRSPNATDPSATAALPTDRDALAPSPPPRR